MLYDDAQDKIEAALEAVKRYDDKKSHTYFLQGFMLDFKKMWDLKKKKNTKKNEEHLNGKLLKFLLTDKRKNTT